MADQRLHLVREPGGGSFYGLLAQSLRDKIQSGEFAIGERLPAETRLATMFGVSRPVVRQALSLLEADGLIYRIQGRGTFVTSQKFRSRVMEIALGPESDTIRFRSRLRTRIMILEREMPDYETTKNLNILPGQLVVYMKRIRYFDDEPLAILESRIPHDLAPGLQDIDLTDQSLYETLEQQFKITITHLRRSIEATLLSEDEATLLGSLPARPALKVSSFATDAGGSTIEQSVAIYRADKITLVTELDTSSGDFHSRRSNESD